MGLTTWMLAKLNPEKTRQIKNALSLSGTPSSADRLAELKGLYNKGLITADEYKSKRADILNGL